MKPSYAESLGGLFTNDSHLQLSGYVSKQNGRIRSGENPHVKHSMSEK